MEEKIINEENEAMAPEILETSEDVVEIANVVEAEAEIAAEKDVPAAEAAEEATAEEAEAAEENSAPAELSEDEYFEMTGLTPAQKKRREIWDKITTGILIFLMTSPVLILAYIFIWFIVNITSR